MKRTRTLALLTALVCLCVSLTACSPKEVLKSAILKTTTALGLRQETSDEDEVDDLSYATSGGDVTFPETMDTTAYKFGWFLFNFCLTNAVLPCIIKENLPVRGGNTRVTFEDLQELLAEQFSCDTSELERGVTLADLGADHEDMVELAWGLGEAVGTEIDESDLSVDFTIGELWRFVHDAEENADL